MINREIIKSSDELTRYSSGIFRANLEKKSNLELYRLYKVYLDKQCKVYNYGVIPVYLDFYKPHLTSYLVEYLKGRKDLFAQLTIPEKLSKVQEEEISLLKTAVKQKKLKQHIEQYRYMGYNFEGPAFPDSYFIKRIKEALRDKVRPQTKIALIKQQKLKEREEHDRLVKILQIDKEHQKLLNLTKGFIYSKDYRKMSLVQSYYELEPLLRELANRFDLTLAEIRNCRLDEIKQMALGKPRPTELSARMQGCLFVVLNRKLPGKVLVDSRYHSMRHYLLQKEDLTEVNFFHGQTACIGRARGRVKIISGVKDLKKMKDGDIMVAQMTNPDLVPAMKKAAAIVTDLGGITSHAAIVSRELKKPCVIGTKIATKVLKDGDLVEVDANNATIKKI
ncbi:MAG: hypothetical protein HY395_01825 [Candidatus Doudnabacteria bacterium]|nr:hypothetical protein [Candidatus Doudnabacteria bacterium]